MPDHEALEIHAMRLAVSIPFVRGCDECRMLVEGASIAAIRDAKVTSITLRPGKEHAHKTLDGDTPTPTPATVLPGQSALFAAQLPKSDTNGFDPNL